MSSNHNYLIFVPARGGSKGIPGKNLHPLCGKPLISHTLEVIAELGLINQSFISTDDEKICDHCIGFGFEMSYRRPAALATDESPVMDSIFDLLNWLTKKNKNPDTVMMLQPTSPLRTAAQVRDALSIFEQTHMRALASVCPVLQHPYECVEANTAGGWEYLREPGQKLTRRQDYEDSFYFIDGSIYIATVDFLREYETFTVPGRTELYITSQRNMPDIDEPEDLVIAEALLKENLVSER